MRIKPPEDSFTFKVTISARSNPELFNTLKDAGPYHRSKLLVLMAQLGLVVQSGKLN
jgi:hypothetical protein